MTDFANLPADITPAALFAAIEEALAHEPAPAGASPEKLVIHVDSDVWSVGFDGGALRIATGATANPPLQVSLTTADFRAFVAGSIRDAVKAQLGDQAAVIDPKQVAKVYALTGKTEQVRAYKGDLSVIVENGADKHRITLTFGGGTPNPAAPTTTISVTLEDFLAMTSGQLNAQAAFFAGKIRLDGDMNLAMGLMALAMA